MSTLSSESRAYLKELERDPQWAALVDNLASCRPKVPRWKPSDPTKVNVAAQQANWIYKSGLREGADNMLRLLEIDSESLLYE